MKLLSVVLLATAFALALAAPASAATQCGGLTTYGHRYNNIKTYAIPCSLGRAVLRSFARRGLRSFDTFGFSYAGGRASFYCLFYTRRGGAGKCKGGVRRGGRTPYYGTVDWLGVS